MATPQVQRLISKPFLGLESKSRDTYRVVVEGRLEGKNFLPPEGSSSSIVNLYKVINEQDYNKIRQRDGDNFVLKENLGNGIEFLAVNAILNENKLATNNLTSQNIKQNAREWGKIIKEQAIAAVEEHKEDYVNKTNLKPGTATVAETTGDAKSQATPIVGTEKIRRRVKLIFAYPSDMKTAQDKIKFSVWTNRTKDIDKYTNVKIGPNIEPNISLLANREKDSTNYSSVAGSPVVYLPITKISDSNTVDWNEDNLSTIQSTLAAASFAAMKGDNQDSIRKASDLLNYTKTGEFGDMVRLNLAGQAVGVGGLLTRATGEVFNPNLELLFRGPQLRSFAFSFSMIPKGPEDATNIKDIIKFFKKNMAVRTTDSNVFLKSPYVFKVEYVTGTSSEDPDTAPEKLHKSLNKIKLCALQSCSVDYTPMGSYMTFADTDRTMFMYNLGLQFKELTPIYDDDYVDDDYVDKDPKNIHKIGY